jgi:KDO2-lipid IV(A) lauroyltransferase
MRHVLGPDASKGQLRRAARGVLRNVARYYVDLSRIPHLDVENFRNRRLKHYGFDENFLPALAQGRGVILASAHMASPELVLQGLLAVNIRVLGLTEPLKPPILSRLIDGLRGSQGHTFLPVNIKGVKAAIRTLKSGGVVALMGDRDIEGRSLSLPLCGDEAKVPVGVVELALRTGAVIVPIFAHRTRGANFEAYIEPPIDVERTGDFEADLRMNVERFLQVFEQHLRMTPEQWIVLEKVWDDESPARDGSCQPWLVGRRA